MEFGKQEKSTKQFMLINWIRRLKVDDNINGNRPYPLPYFPFSEYESILKNENIYCYNIPFDLLHDRRVCKSAIMNILGVGKNFWSTCEEILENGPKPSPLQNNTNASKEDVKDDLMYFFKQMEDLSEPVATVVVRMATKDKTKLAVKKGERGQCCLPPHYSKRSLYSRYCYEHGYLAKQNNSGTFTSSIREDDDWKVSGEIETDICSYWTFFYHWKTYHPHIIIRRPAKDICHQCFVFSQAQKYKHNDMDDNEEDDDDEQEYDGESLAIGIKRLPEAVINQQEDTILKAAKHVAEARSMREYANDKITLCKSRRDFERSQKVITIVCDYSQNGEMPSFGNEQPGEVYYYSPLSIFIFGIVEFDQEIDSLTTYCYNEGVAKKGGNNVASLLVKHISKTVELLVDDPLKELKIIMDNCAGQNKNRMVI